MDRGEAKVMFVMDKEVPNGKANTISNAIKDMVTNKFAIENPELKVVGLGSDGAAVMMGRNTGVGM